MKTFVKAKQNLSVIQLYFILRYHFLSQPCPAADWSHFSKGADGWRFVPDRLDSYWILFSAGQMDIKKYIRARKQCETCPSFYSTTRCLCMLTDEVGLKCNQHGSSENDFLLKPSVLYPCKCFCKRGINSHYLHQSRLFIWTSFHAWTHKAWVKGQTPTPMSPPIISSSISRM